MDSDPARAAPDAGAAAVRCETHGLHYARSESGCVLCRRSSAEQAPARAPRRRKVAVAVSAALALAAAGLTFALARPEGSDMRVGAFGESASKSGYVGCLRTCARTNEQCVPACPEGELAETCRGECLFTHTECTLRCGLEHRAQLDRDAFVYATSTAPPWDEMLLALEPALAEMAECSERDSRVTVRLATAPGERFASGAVVLTHNNNPVYQECARAALRTAELPPGPYALVATIDPREDALERALRFARLELEAAEDDGDAARLADVRSRLWRLRNTAQMRIREKQLEAKRRAEEAARQKLFRPDYRTAGSYPPRPYSPPKYSAAKYPEPSRSSAQSRPPRKDDAWARERERRLREQHADEERRRAEKRRMEVESQMREVERKLRWENR